MNTLRTTEIIIGHVKPIEKNKLINQKYIQNYK